MKAKQIESLTACSRRATVVLEANHIMTPAYQPLDNPPKLCPICENPLSSTDYLFHEECTKCVHCGSPVHKDIVSKLLESGNKQIYHVPCHDAKLREDFKKSPVTVNQEHLDMLNKCLFPFQPNMELTKETNQEVTCNALRPWLQEVGNTPEDEKGIDGVDRLFYIVANLEATAAMVHTLIGKNKTYATDRDNKRLIEKFKEKDELIKDVEKRKTAQKESNQRQFERLDTAARARRNAIGGYMKIFKCDEAIATMMVDKAKEAK